MATSSPPPKISKRIEKELYNTKVVMRRLPPNFTEEDFQKTFSPLPPYNYFYFSPGDPSLGVFGCSRAYLDFVDESTIMPFRNEHDGRVLEMDKGKKYRVVIEYAPFQSVPKKMKRKPDARCATIEQDSDYTAFLEFLDSKPELLPCVDLFSSQQATKPSSAARKSALIEYLEEKKAARAARAGKKNKVYVVDKKRKGDPSSKGKDRKSSSEVEGISSSKNPKSQRHGYGKGEEARKGKREGKTDESASATKLDQEERMSEHVKHGGGCKDSDGQASREKDWQEDDGKRGERRTSGNSRRGNPQENDDTSEDVEKGRSRRPDRAIYVPRGGGKSRGTENDYTRSERDYPSKTKRDYSSTKYDRDNLRNDNDTKDCSIDQGSRPFTADNHGRRDRREKGRGRGERYYEDRDWVGKPRDRGYRGRGRGYRFDTYDKQKTPSHQDR